MDIRPKYAIGTSVWTIRRCKATEIKVDEIIIRKDGIRYRSGGDYQEYAESECFPSKTTLMAYVEAG